MRQANDQATEIEIAAAEADTRWFIDDPGTLEGILVLGAAYDDTRVSLASTAAIALRIAALGRALLWRAVPIWQARCHRRMGRRQGAGAKELARGHDPILWLTLNASHSRHQVTAGADISRLAEIRETSDPPRVAHGI